MKEISLVVFCGCLGLTAFLVLFARESGNHIPPKPVANPTVPSEASSSIKKDPSTLIPQLVRDWRYCSHLEHGVEMSVSISL